MIRPVHVHANAYKNSQPAHITRKTPLNRPRAAPEKELGDPRPTHQSSATSRYSNRRYLTGCRPTTPPAQILDCTRQGTCRGGFCAPACPRRGLLALTQPRERVGTLHQTGVPGRPRRSYRHLEWRRPVPDARGGRGGWWRYSHKHWLDQRRPHCRAVTPQLTIGSDVLKPVYSHLCSQLGVTVVTVDSEAFTSLLWASAMVWSRQTPQGAVLVAHTVQKPLLHPHTYDTVCSNAQHTRAQPVRARAPPHPEPFRGTSSVTVASRGVWRQGAAGGLIDTHLARARPYNGWTQHQRWVRGDAALPSPSAGSPRPHRRLPGRTASPRHQWWTWWPWNRESKK